MLKMELIRLWLCFSALITDPWTSTSLRRRILHFQVISQVLEGSFRADQPVKWVLESVFPDPPLLSPPQMDSPAATPAPPPLHLLTPVTNSDVSSPCEQIMVRTRSVAVNTADVALATEPECLGPCEPGTSVNLEGIVWQETEDGAKAVELYFGDFFIITVQSE